MSNQPHSRERESQGDADELSDRLQELELTLELLADLVVVVDGQRRVVQCNGAVERVWGLTPAEVLGQPMPTSSHHLHVVDRYGSIVQPESVPTIRALITGRPQRAPVLGIRHPNGTTTWARVVAIPVGGSSSPSRVVSVWTDISASIAREADLSRMNLELERRVEERTKALEATIAELEAFSYSVSHDLRTPVRTISNLAETLLLDLAIADGQDTRHVIDRIHAAAVRMDGLIEVLLGLSAAATSEPQRDRIDLSSMAREELQRLADRYPACSVEGVVESGIYAEGNEQLIAVVLHNLLTNAWKFTAGVDRRRLEVGVLQPVAPQDEPVYFVRDNGIGFDMERAGDLFAPFFRLDSAQEFEGTGVGLAIVHRIIGRHGGRVWAESSPGNGATFYFTLPTVAEHVVPARPSR